MAVWVSVHVTNTKGLVPDLVRSSVRCRGRSRCGQDEEVRKMNVEVRLNACRTDGSLGEWSTDAVP